MKTNYRRIALLTGASVAALGIALPAQAQIVPPHTGMPDGTYPGFVTTDDTIEICDLATPPGDPCFFGVIDTGTPVATAQVNSFASGQGNQNPLGPVGVMANNGTAEFGAVAVATGGLAATAVASATNILYQSDFAGLGDVDLTIDNNGGLLFDAVASASATAGVANADATLNVALHQQGTGDVVSLVIDNDGDMEFLATAIAVGTAGANATAAIGAAMTQIGTGNSVTLTLVNDGSLIVSADADASATVAGPAFASASADGVQQTAVGATFASVNYDNNGAFVVTADADAIALGGIATATAFVSYGISQEVDVAAGTGLASVTNDGTMTIGAYAFASGTAGASASAYVSDAIVQTVDVAADGSASAAFDNNNVLNVSALATAIATSGSASAFAGISEVIDQEVNVIGTGTAVASVANAGTIDVAAIASVSGTTGFNQNATASVSGVIEQDVDVGFGDASAIVSNTAAGVISVLASANAVGGNANAVASISEVLEQDVNSGGDGAALADINNAGIISVQAVASVSGTISVDAFVSLEDIIEQDVSGGIDGTALARITNDGSITISGTAVGVGTTGVHTATANAEFLISQFAEATEGAGAAVAVASASIVNGTAGVIDIDLAASAAGTKSASAFASLEGAITQQAVGSLGADAVANLDNDGVIDIDIAANAAATSFAVAIAGFTGPVILQQATALGLGGTAQANIDNSGSIDIHATASASATQGFAFAFAGLTTTGYAIEQNAIAGDTASVSFTNSGSVSLGASAVADGHTVTAVAIMGGVHQVASAPLVDMSFINSGTMSVSADASAHGSTAFAAAVALGNQQEAAAVTSAIQSASNTGLISVHADAFADGADSASALAVAGSGMAQYASAAFVSQSMINSGTVDVAAVATATAGQIGVAIATAVSFDAMAQYASGSSVAQYMSNSTDGLVSLAATANATGAGLAIASANAITAMYQAASGVTVTQTMVNAGTVTSTANANAVANGTVIATTGEEVNVGTAVAIASAYGMGQTAAGGFVAQSMTNSGTLNVGAHALASAPAVATADGAPASGFALAFASATGAYQANSGATTALLNFTNSGEINVNAAATAVGTTGAAVATAVGYYGFGGGGATLTAAIANTGTMNVSATAVSPGSASALAVGIVLENEPTLVFAGTPTPVLVDIVGNPVNGTITNDGVINVVASASGGTASSATATGILIMSGINNMVVTNSGTIAVDAITANGGSAEANGVVVEANGTVVPGVDDQFTFTNDGGTIIVRESDDGGATWRRGTAIDVSAAPNYSVINLLGDGTIYGNIDVAEGDDIFVEAGTTYFDGIINPECHVDYGGLGPDYDNPLVNACGQGTLTIQNGGNLYLADSPFGGDATMYDGPSYVFVDTFNVAADGTITFELNPEAGGDQPIGTYPQVFADVANLDGTLVADITPAGGLFADSYFWNNVIDAEVRNGTFDQCVIAGSYADSVLLDLDCIYDGQNNVDLGLTRIAFDAVPGLNQNQGSVAGGLECLYDDLGPDGLIGTGLGDAIAELFLFNGTDYPQALQQLAGAGYAGYLQSFNSLGYHYNQILARATDCEIPTLAGSALACRVAPMHLWGQVDYDTINQDGDVELGDYDADRWSFLIGGDISVTPAAVIGASVGKVTNKVNYDDLDARVKGDGWQFGLYGTYDPGQFYVKALSTYTKMDGDARRGIDFTGFGGTTAGQLEGDPDVRLWTFGLHGGFRLPMGPTSVITPFLNYDYTDAKLKGFTETGGTGVELSVNGGREKHSWLTGGVKWAGQMGGLVPEASIGYRHMFGDRRASFNTNFAGFDANCDFDIVSMTEKRGALLAGLSIGGMFGMVDVRVGYNGAFNSDMQEHSGFLKLVVPLGAVAAPPPPPVVVAPPPPPAPATQTCPDGSVILATDICPAPPPPPPPPAPAPERG